MHRFPYRSASEINAVSGEHDFRTICVMWDYGPLLSASWPAHTRRAARIPDRGGKLAAADKGHLGRHDRHELDIGV
jgi:hypothetical protein